MASLVMLPASMRMAAMKNAAGQRAFHTSSAARASVLFALGALSNSRETAHFNRISGLPRYEHSPPLKAIKNSEVDPFPLPTPSPPLPPSNAWARSGSASHVWDDKALNVGRVILADQVRQSQRLRRTMFRLKRRQVLQGALVKKERLAWHRERMRLERDVRAAVMWILASIAVATALAAWRFFPETTAKPDSAELGRKIAARAAAAMPLPAAVASHSTDTTVTPSETSTKAGSTKREVPHSIQTSEPAAAKSSWFKGLFWKQQSGS